MLLAKPDTMSLLPRVSRLGRQGFGLTLSAFACFSIASQDEHALLEEAEMWGMLPDILGREAVFDEGYAKPRGEFLVYGRCHPPPDAGDTLQGLEVRVTVGSVGKRLQVFGERYFDGRLPMPPRPLQPFPLDWAHAYGGPDCLENPLGLGHGDLAPGAPLPQILAARDHEDDLRHASPAGLRACPPNWPQRATHLGAFDTNWLVQDWPHLPGESSVEFFCTAPEDQRLRGYFAGVEPLEVVGMHPARPVLQGSLPGLRVRLFVRRKDRDALEEVPNRADTLWIFPEQELAVLCYRGVAQVADDEAADIEAVVGGWEPLRDKELPHEHYLELLRSEEQDALPEEESEERADSPTKDEPAHDAASSAAVSAQQPAPASVVDLGPLEEIVRGLEAAAGEQLQRAGLSAQDVEALLARDLGDETREDLDLMRIAKDMEREARQLLQERGLAEQDVLRLLQQAAEGPEVQDPGAWYDAVAAMPDATPEMRQAAAEGTQALAEFRKAMAAFEALATGSGPEPEQKKVAEEITKESPPPSEQPPDLPPHLDFRGQDLRKRSFRNAELDGANFSGANLAGADFGQALLRGAVFTDTTCLGADFEGCIAQQARFQNADLRHCSFARADCCETDCSAAQMEGADLSFALFHNADMHMTSLVECQGLHTEFMGSQLQGADFTNSVLTGADFSDCILDGAALRESLLDNASFNGAQARGALMRDTCLHGARADRQTDFSMADFRLADFCNARWQGANCSRANFWGALLDGASLEQARLDGCVLKTVSARNTNFDKADLQGANLRHSNLFGASLRKAVLRHARLGNTNLFAADLLGAHMDDAKLENVITKRTVLDMEKLHG